MGIFDSDERRVFSKKTTERRVITLLILNSPSLVHVDLARVLTFSSA